MWLDREISLLPSEGGILDFSILLIFNVSLNVTICLSEVVSPFFSSRSMKTSFADSSLPENEYFIMFRVIYFHELLVFLEAFLSFPVQS